MKIYLYISNVLKVLPMLLATVMLAGCSTDDQEGNQVESIIGWHVTTIEASTRGGTPLTTASFPVEGRQFRLWAWMYRDGSDPVPMYTKANPTPLSNVLVTYANGLWTTADKYYWPPQSYSVDFYAVHPASANFSDADRSVVYTDDNPVNGHDDLMVAKTTASRSKTVTEGADGQTPTQAVTLPFNHALTQVAFRGVLSASMQEKGWQVAVTGITLHNVHAAGTYDCTTGVFSTDIDNPRLMSYALTMEPDEDSGIIFITSTEKRLTSLTDIPMLMPQEQEAWTPATEAATTGTGRAVTSGSYIAVECHIWNPATGEDYVGSADSFATVYAPIAISWLPGKRYVYSLTFGTGYTADGTAIEPIYIDATINDWIDNGTVFDGQAQHVGS